jgi:NADPH-dependent glutamate synthase beta subunit-like oxidoreductase
MKDSPFKELPLFIPHSSISTAVNKTGSWRFFHPIYDEKTAPCSAACPVGQDIARIEMLTSWGLLKDAWQLILNENPFPAVCGRVCFHPCENACNRSNLDASIAIHNLERFLGDTALLKERIPDLNFQPARDKSVAIAGAGPAGLSAAHFLTRLGYRCEVFEANSAPGGLLRQGIPAYRLPRDILDLEIKRIENQGVTIHCDYPLTGDLLEKICDEYDALFIGCGYGRSITLNIDGGHLADDGLDFLRRLHQGENMSFAGQAVIFGGGNTAIDVARCLARLGASPLIVYRRRIQDMPAFEPEVAMALQEGVDIMELVAPIHIRQNQSDSSSSGSRYTLTLQQMKISKTEISGRTRVIPDGEKTKIINVEHIFVAIGAEADALWHFPATDNPKTLSLSHCKLIEQKLPLVFGGDLTSPVKSVADAIASGKQAAMALNTYFEKGLEAVDTTLAACRVGSGPALSLDTYLAGNRHNRNAHVVTYDEIVTDYFQTAPRATPSSLDANRRLQSFTEAESTLTSKVAKEEAARCFNCGTCNACDYCRLYCPEMAVKVDQGQRSIDMDYCKGCGVCATECPRNAMALEEEIK